MQRVSLVELHLGQHIVRVDVGQSQGRARSHLHLGVPAHHGGRVALRLFVRVAGSGQQQAPRVAVVRAVQAHPVEARFVEGERREARPDLVADHQSKGAFTLAIRGDDQPVEEVPVRTPRIAHQALRRQPSEALVHRAAARPWLLLRPAVDQPSSPQLVAEHIVRLLSFELAVDVARVELLRVVGLHFVPRMQIGFRQVPRLVPLVQRRGCVIHRETLARRVDRRHAPALANGHSALRTRLFPPQEQQSGRYYTKQQDRRWENRR